MLDEYTCEVFDSEGTLAIQGPDGQDVAHLVWVDRTTATDDAAEPTWHALSDEERQDIIDRIVGAVTVRRPSGGQLEALLAEALAEREKFDPANNRFADGLYHYFDGKVSGLREALGQPIEEPTDD